MSAPVFLSGKSFVQALVEELVVAEDYMAAVVDELCTQLAYTGCLSYRIPATHKALLGDVSR